MNLSSLQYPKGDPLYGDFAILKNAVNFTTGQRAFRAFRILREPLDYLNSQGRAYLSLEGFEQFIVTLEDLQGWIFVLHRWDPGAQVDRSLFGLLDTTRVGVGQFSEEAALELVKSLDPTGYRNLIHLPPSEELLKAGFPETAVKGLSIEMAPQLEGLTRAIEIRGDNERAFVKAYNKSKHLLLGILRMDQDKPVIALRTAYSYKSSPISLDGADLGCEASDVRRRAYQTIHSQAVLNHILSLILWTRYGEELETPPWVESSLHLPGLRDTTDEETTEV